MKKSMFAFLAFASLLPLFTQAAESPTALCRVSETLGRREERYDFRLALPEDEAQFQFRLYPKVMAMVSVGTDSKKPMFYADFLDYDMPDAETNGEMLLGSAAGYFSVKLEAKVGRVKDRSLSVHCSIERE